MKPVNSFLSEFGNVLAAIELNYVPREHKLAQVWTEVVHAGAQGEFEGRAGGFGRDDGVHEAAGGGVFGVEFLIVGFADF